MRSRATVVLTVILLARFAASPAERAATADYRKALPGYKFQLPRDYFDHPEFRTEWWYYTGNLRSPDGRRFGYELTFFRHGVARTRNEAPNVWDVNDVWLAHFAVSDIDGGRFHHTERMNRSGAGQAGVDATRGLIWNGNWRVEWRLDNRTAAGFNEQRLSALGEGFRVDLQMRSDKPAVIHGTNGVSQKAAGAGRASHYVSLTRLLTQGTIVLRGNSFKTDGLSWMDHEFFTHSLEANQSGWDWFSLQLQDGSELMLYRLRRNDGLADPYSSGTHIAPGGRATHLAAGQYSLEPTRDNREMWTSPQTKGRYPLRWTLRVPSLGLEATATTRLRQQEIVGRVGGSPSYWEGAIDLRGSQHGQPIVGSGYLEMTGYSGAVRMGQD